MTIQELVSRLERLGFLCQVNHFAEDDETRLIVRKLRSTPGNHLQGNVVTCDLQEDGVLKTIDLDGVAPMIWFRPDGIEYFVSATIPRSRGAYEKTFRDPAEVYEEVLHYFFDADSPMSVEVGFVAGPGRQAGA
jgi:hypothetical protein